MKAITIRQPWAWAIVHLGKRIENRTWPTYHVGPLLIHASSGMTGIECDAAIGFMYERGLIDEARAAAFDLSSMRKKLDKGGIVARAKIVDLIHPGGLGGRLYPSGQAARGRHRLADDPWYVGDYGFVLGDVEPVPFVPCKGERGLWEVPADVLATIDKVAPGGEVAW